MTSKYEAVRKAIIEAVPNIMELKFGCLVKCFYHGIEFTQTILSRTAAGNFLVRTGVGETTTTIKQKDIKQILGRLITLEDVLRVLDDKAEGDLEMIKDNLIRIYNKWWLGNPLSEQSPEVIEWIYKIIC